MVFTPDTFSQLEEEWFMPMRILIANRGEIAVRIARSIIEMGHTPLGVYTSIDVNSLHRRFVHEDAEVSSYLDIDEIVEAAIHLGADAIHPGYGFLSENSEFARRVINKGLTWIGPSPEAIDRAGDKLGLKETAMKLGIPTLPYTLVRDASDIEEFAREHGYPVILKAAGGGGGIGMRVIHDGSEIESKLELSLMEVGRAFKDTRVYVEPYLDKSKHIEIQVIGDGENVIHLYERECSIQLRYQKIIEEAPSPSISPDERRDIVNTAVELMRALRYDNAGTVEFIFDVKKRRFYLMEVNARIQVEHPVTEMVTGIDIVKMQVEVAFERALGLRQDDISLRGHSIEARIQAVNPLDFSGSPGHITRLIEPSGPGVRVDSGAVAGSYVSIDYNPLISKVIVYGSDRDEALKRLRRALDEYVIEGVQTNIPFIKAVLASEDFKNSTHTTRFVEENMDMLKKKIEEELAAQALATAVVSFVKPDFNKVFRARRVVERSPESRVEEVKRRAWTYWSLARSKLKRR
jgi:pyruvate carboxylase subunit A